MRIQAILNTDKSALIYFDLSIIAGQQIRCIFYAFMHIQALPMKNQKNPAKELEIPGYFEYLRFLLTISYLSTIYQ